MSSDAPPRPASSVMLLRNAPSAPDGHLEVFVLHRVAAMVFAPSVTVFPGGGVDPSDSTDIAWSGPTMNRWAAVLGTEPMRARALVVAAVRELFEETGVLLADRPATEEDRTALAEHRCSLSQLFAARGLTLQSNMLRPWANWITPMGNTRRYDTFFFVAAQPPGQNAEALTTEAESGRWARPADLLAEHGAGTLPLLPPTLAMLTDLERAQTVEQVWGQRRQIVPLPLGTRIEPGEPLEFEVDGLIYSVRVGGEE